MYVCHLDDLTDGCARGFSLQGSGQSAIFIVRRGAELKAYVDACPHHGPPLPWRKDAYLNGQGDRIVCAAHGALFDIATGQCTAGAALGQSLTPVPLNIDSQGKVHLAQTNYKETLI